VCKLHIVIRRLASCCVASTPRMPSSPYLDEDDGISLVERYDYLLKVPDAEARHASTEWN
jgi:hypothetical protein